MSTKTENRISFSDDAVIDLLSLQYIQKMGVPESPEGHVELFLKSRERIRKEFNSASEKQKEKAQIDTHGFLRNLT